MQLSQVPAQLVEAWAMGDTTKTNPIPVPSQQGITPGAASWTDGFPPLCATPLASGGIPPSKADMNGGLYQMSAVDVWMCAGGGFPYNSAFQTAIGGYPKGARVLMASGGGYWVSTVDNNMTDPDTGGAGWATVDTNAITALTGDVSATGPGSAVAAVKWPSPGTIGSTTPNTGAFTTLTATTPGSSDNSTNAATTAWCLLGFAVSLGANGYLKLPRWLGGVVMQWGTTGTLPSNSTQSVSFQIAFPTSCFALVGSDSGPRVAGGNPQPVALAATSLSAFNVIIGGSGETVTWIAIGN